MLIPIRCFTCGKVIGNKWDKYLKYQQELKKKNEKDVIKKSLDKLELNRYCCRRMFLSHIEITLN